MNSLKSEETIWARSYRTANSVPWLAPAHITNVGKFIHKNLDFHLLLYNKIRKEIEKKKGTSQPKPTTETTRN